MSPFGKGMLLGMFAAVLMLSMKHSGIGGWWIILTIFCLAVFFTWLPNEWVNKRTQWNLKFKSHIQSK